MSGVKEKFDGVTKVLKLEELLYTLGEGTRVRFDARLSFELTVEEMETITLEKILKLLDSAIFVQMNEDAEKKKKREVKRTIILD